MPRFLTPSRRVASSPRLPAAQAPRPAPISREDTLAELRTIYRLLDTEQIHTAKQRLITLGKNLHA